MPSPWEAGHKADLDAHAERIKIGLDVIALLGSKDWDTAIEVLVNILLAMPRPKLLILLAHLSETVDELELCDLEADDSDD